jgi:hypothetical protein
MPFQFRVPRTTLPVRPLASTLSLLMVLGVPFSIPAQAPVPAAAAPKTVDAATPVKAKAAPSGESTQGTMQIQDLLASLARFDQNGRDPAQKIGFEIPERAVNEYLAYVLRNRPRPGISAITVTLLPNNEISGVVEIDFKAVTGWNPEILPEPLRALLSGKQAIKVNARLESRNGTFSFLLKDAQGPDGKQLSNKMMSEILQSIGSRQPESYDTAKPMPLPFGLKRVWTEKQSVCGET